MIDRELVTRKIALILGDLSELRAVAAKSRDEYRIAACAGLRNRIVHEYNDIDPGKVYEAVQAAVNDIPDYLRCVNQYAEKSARG